MMTARAIDPLIPWEWNSLIRGMRELYAGLVRARVPVEANFFVNGEHGVGFAEGDPVLGRFAIRQNQGLVPGSCRSRY